MPSNNKNRTGNKKQKPGKNEGDTTKQKYGEEFYHEIGKTSGKTKTLESSQANTQSGGTQGGQSSHQSNSNQEMGNQEDLLPEMNQDEQSK